MGKKHCSQLGNLPKNEHDVYRSDLYVCKITGKECMASSYENWDPGHPASTEVAEYDDHLAKDCPAYDIPDELVEQIKEFKLRVRKSKLEKQIDEIDAKLK